MMICKHGFVRNDFGKGITTLLLKDKLGSQNQVDNYRAMTVSPLISKFFEYCLLDRFEHILVFSDLKFGFKHKFSCTHAIFFIEASN